MKNFKGDLLESNCDMLVHCANLYHTFGSGIAYFIKRKFPEAYQADLETENGCESRLGTYSKASISNNRVLYNLYAMVGIGNSGHPIDRNLSYDHFYNGLYNVCVDAMHSYKGITPLVVGVPKYIGCARAGGNWTIVETILNEIESEFEDKIEIHVYELEEPEVNPKSTLPQNFNPNLGIFY